VSADRALPLPGTVRRWAPIAPVVPADLILRLQKYRDLARVPRAIRLIADAVASEASRLLAPEAVLWRGPVTEVDPAGAISIGDAHHFHSRALARLLATAAEAYVVVLTLGEGIDERARSMLREQLLVEGLLMDTAAWAAIELLLRDVRRFLLDQERVGGRSVTHRLGPGHRDWPVTEQAALLRVFGEVPLPVSVNESACMLPRKSVSGVYGIVPAS
jgi:hypothetical protein